MFWPDAPVPMWAALQGGPSRLLATKCPLWVKSGLSSQNHSMSALLPKADVATRPVNVRLVPVADIHVNFGRPNIGYQMARASRRPHEDVLRASPCAGLKWWRDHQ